MKEKYPLSKPYITEKEKRLVKEVLDSGCLSLGPKQDKFEQKFSQRIGVRYAAAVSSGTAGLHLAMLAAGIKQGDEVITSPFSFVSSANCILYVGATPVFADINPITYNIDPKEIEKKVTKKTKAILVVHIFGQAAEMEPIRQLAKKHKLKIIEDACESINATHKGKKVGTFGQSAVFAFYGNKQMTTAEGGMLVTNNEKIYSLCRSLRNQGRTENKDWLEHQHLGYNYRMTEMSAALGLAQLAKLDYLIKQRQKIAAWYNKHLSGFDRLVQTPQIAKNNTHTWFLYVVQLKRQGVNRAEVIKRLKNKGISTKPYFPCIHLLDFYRKKYHYKKGDLPVAEKVSQATLALPLYVGLKEKDICYIAKELLVALKM